MKIGVSSYSFSAHIRHTHCSYNDICDIAKELGYDGIEFIDLSLDIQSAESLADLAREIRNHCDQIGLPITAYTVSADFLENEDQVEQLKAKIDIAEILGAKLLRHDVTWRRDVEWHEIISRTADSIRAVTEYAQSKGIRTCTENHGYVMQDAYRVEQLVRTVNHPNYGWLVDMGNFLCADENPEKAVSIAAPYAFHVHAKDFLLKYDAEKPGDSWFATRSGGWLRGTVVGHGVVPVAQCVRVLQNAGYDGWLSLEFEGAERNMLALKEGLAFLRRVTA